MNKRSTWLLMAVLMLAGCDEKAENTCGNGVLDSDEVCDGELFKSSINTVCSNGVKPNMSAVKCTSTCTLDMTEACSPVCGNGVIEGDEQCDGLAIPLVQAGCSNPDMSKLRCETCKLINDGVCPDNVIVDPVNPDWYPETCGNGTLDTNELCDGDKIRASAKICPENTIELGNPVYKCLDSCRLVDVSKACIPGVKTECGNGILEADEQCDGGNFSNKALEAIVCDKDYHFDEANLGCNAKCEIESACAPNIRNDVGVIISEVVPHMTTVDNMLAFDGLGFELTNMSKDSANVASCSLALISEAAIEKKFAFSQWSLNNLKANESLVFCWLADGKDKFDGACNFNISDENIHSELMRMAYIGVVCGDKDEIVDLFNLNSFRTAVQHYGVDFVRKCNAEPATTPATALMSIGWADVVSSPVGAPAYGLGEHCIGADANVEYCKYTISRNTLDNRSQSIDLALEIKIPGVTDKSDKTDKSSGIQIQFVSGEVKGSTVDEKIIHLIFPTADMEWTNADGVDRYVGKLRNWDEYDGFWASDAGTYTLDAFVSFDNGVTRTFCGPKGVIEDYESYDPQERNTLVVSYDDDGAVCNDGILTSSEVCDGYVIREEALECENEGEVIFDKSKIECKGCNSISTASACAEVPLTCGNDKVEEGEVCDGRILPDFIKVCPNRMVEIDNPVWKCSETCLAVEYENACEIACGNGKVDLSLNEVCDGDNFLESKKVCPKGYIVKDNPVWACSSKCDEIITDDACELSCGNGKIDGTEVCDGKIVNEELASASCKAGTTYDSSRASCLEGCTLDLATCVYDKPLVFDEFAVKYDENNKAKGVAISINLYGEEPIDVADTSCSLILLNEKGSTAVTSASYFNFMDMVGAPLGAEHFNLDPCKPIVICSEPVASEKEYENIWGDECDALLGGFDLDGKIVDNILLNPKVDTIQISCGGTKIDYFDMAGLREAIAEGINHGKLKSSDKRPYAGRTTVELENRMDLDKSLDMSKFAKNVCE